MNPNALATTTTTLNWILVKYSRSCTTPEPVAKRQKLGEIKPHITPKPQFDHFVQPQLSLRLETTRSASARDYDLPITHSILLSVLYDPHYSDTTRCGYQVVTLDRFDLMDFSSPVIRSHCPPDELPLKGVYKDETLGLRYLFLDAAIGASFRRVQFKFESTSERERFMASVQGIIPIKLASATTSVPSMTTSATHAQYDNRRYGNAESSNCGQRGSSPSFTTAPPLISGPSPATTNYFQHSPCTHPFAEQQLAGPPLLPSAPPRANATPLPARSTTRLASLFSHPNMGGTTQEEEDGRGRPATTDVRTACERLAAMDAPEFANFVDQVLFEEGFEELLRRIEGYVNYSGG